VGDAELFRYSRALLDRWKREHAGEPWLTMMAGLPYVDYYVEQFWSDLLALLPEVREPVPQWLASTLGPDRAWTSWERQAAAATEPLPKAEAIDLLYDATRWLGKRTFDSAYLVSGPEI
jgi:hypothetical protein